MFALEGKSRSFLSIRLALLAQIHTSLKFSLNQVWQQIELRHRERNPFLKDDIFTTALKRRRVSFTDPSSWMDDAVRNIACSKVFNDDNMKTNELLNSSAKALPGKSPEIPLDKNNPENADFFERLGDIDDAKTEANVDGPLYSDFFN